MPTRLLFVLLGILFYRGAWAPLQAESPGDGREAAILSRYAVLESTYAAWSTALYKEKRFADIEQQVERLIQEKTEAAHYSATLFIEALNYSNTTLSSDDAFAVIKEWIDHSPHHYLPRLILSNNFFTSAWDARGSGWDKDVSPERAKVYLERLAISKKYLDQSVPLNQHDPNVSNAMMRICRAMGRPYAEMNSYFEIALADSPGNFWAYIEKLRYIMPKWNGTRDDLRAFADEAKAKSDQHPRLGFVWANAQLELHNLSKAPESIDMDPLEDPAIWNEIMEVFDRRLKENPDELPTRSNYAYFANASNRFELAARQFDIIGDRWSPGFRWARLTDYNSARGHAYFKVGWALQNKKDYVAAKTWYKKAIALGNPWAMNNMAWLLQQGYFGERNNKEAMRLYHLAAERDNTLAMLNLGNSYRDGNGVEKNLEMAKKWFRKGADKGDAGACENLGRLYAQDGPMHNMPEAISLLSLASAQNNNSAMNYLGWIYAMGVGGISRDFAKADYWYRQALAHGNTLAADNLLQLETIKATNGHN